MPSWLKAHLNTVSSMCRLWFPLGKAIPSPHAGPQLQGSTSKSSTGQSPACVLRACTCALPHSWTPTPGIQRSSWLMVCARQYSGSRKISLTLRSGGWFYSWQFLLWRAQGQCKVREASCHRHTVKRTLYVSIVGIINSRKHSRNLTNSGPDGDWTWHASKEQNFLKFA